MTTRSVTALTLLDLSAAFDTIDHTIFHDRLNAYYGISDLRLGWIKSYLAGRTQLVKVGSTLLHPAALQFGVARALSLVQLFFLSRQTLSAQSFRLTVVLITTSMPMIPRYT